MVAKEISLSTRIRTVAMVLLGVAALLLKPHYRGPLQPLLWNYLGNTGISFAVYFIVSLSAHSFPRPRLMAALGALAVVESFELLDGFGFMSNTYDPWDLLANALGVALALAVDAATEKYLTTKGTKGAKRDTQR